MNKSPQDAQGSEITIGLQNGHPSASQGFVLCVYRMGEMADWFLPAFHCTGHPDAARKRG